MLTKSRMQGSSVIITLPPHNGEKPESNIEYLVVYLADGTILLVPKLSDPFEGGNEGEFYELDEWEDILSELFGLISILHPGKKFKMSTWFSCVSLCF